MRLSIRGSFAILAICSAPTCANDAPAPVDFLKDVRPIFEKRCFSCHGPAKQKNSLRLDSKIGIQKGGVSGAVVVPGKSADSPLIKHVVGVEMDRMPPNGEPLSAEQIVVIRRWIDGGARIPDDPKPATREKSAGDDWAFRPIAKPPVPTVPAAHHSWMRSPIDAFVLQKVLANGLTPSPEADRRTLMRRLCVDLVGLPPTPTELEAFVNDPASDAYERLVDRLLASPRYGERWARHWLDVAHYADSHGHDQDRPRPNAWPYRDYLIRSFNSDKPYARFVAEQIAGDVLRPGDAEALRATGFLAAGPWDESGLRDIQENSTDREAARYLDRDDVVTSTMATFAGVTVNCARCHDHKFDPIPQRDYYALQAVFAGIDKADRAYDSDPTIASRRIAIAKELVEVRRPVGKADARWLSAERTAEVAAFEKERRSIGDPWTTMTPTTVKSKHGAALKTLLDLSILSVGSRPDRDAYTIAFAGGPRESTGLRLELLCDDTLPHQGPGRQDNGNLHLSEIKIAYHLEGKPTTTMQVAVKRAAADFDQSGWDATRAIDGDPSTAWGIHPEVGKQHVAVFELEKPIPANAIVTVTLDQLHGGGHLIGRFRLSLTSKPLTDAMLPIPAAVAAILATPEMQRTPAQRAELACWLWERRLEAQRASLPKPDVVYCGTKHFKPDGSFRPSATPRLVYLLKRGEATRPEGAVDPGALSAVGGISFSLRNRKEEGDRRAALAAWLTDRSNPLTWRVVVNRVWHYHFGRGIVDTPNDFGKMGGRPSHPELLDWLASEFRDSGGSVKQLHRSMLRSSVYRQVCRQNRAAEEKDFDNRLLWRMNRGRLDAESVRDAILQAAGRLNPAMYGPPIQQFHTKPGVHVTPDVDYERFDLDSENARRRSVYRFILRTRPDPLFAALDCPEASLSAPVRQPSLGAPQALVLWNNRFMLRQAEELAAFATATAATPAEQLRFVARRVLCRPPTASEESKWLDYVWRYGLANFCRVLVNSSEFLFVD